MPTKTQRKAKQTKKQYRDKRYRLYVDSDHRPYYIMKGKKIYIEKGQ